MTFSEFHNGIRCLFNIDGDLLPELNAAEQERFIADPIRYFIRCGDEHSKAIWREVQKRRVPNAEGR